MAKRKRRNKAWSRSFGPYGSRIRLYADPNSGILYAETRDPSLPCGYRARSLGHRDKKRASLWAQKQVAQLMEGNDTLRDQTPIAALVFALYFEHQTPTKSASEQKADQKRISMWKRILGPKKDLSKLTRREWQDFTERRRSGAIDRLGQEVPPEKRRPVRDSTVGGDLVFLRSVVNWATEWTVDYGNRCLMRENPARGFPIPAEKNPRRPVATHDRLEKVLAVAGSITMVVGRGKKRRVERSYLPEILTLAAHTGRRIKAILALRYEDLRLSEGEYGSIFWPSATDKMGREWLVPLNAEARSAIDRVLKDRPGIGAAFLFPAVNNRENHLAVEVASAWLIEAERRAGLQKHNGSLWHAYRRMWATARKHLPLKDVAAAGGWTDTETLLACYQHADQATMFKIVTEAAVLREA